MVSPQSTCTSGFIQPMEATNRQRAWTIRVRWRCSISWCTIGIARGWVKPRFLANNLYGFFAGKLKGYCVATSISIYKSGRFRARSHDIPSKLNDFSCHISSRSVSRALFHNYRIFFLPFLFSSYRVIEFIYQLCRYSCNRLNLAPHLLTSATFLDKAGSHLKYQIV